MVRFCLGFVGLKMVGCESVHGYFGFGCGWFVIWLWRGSGGWCPRSVTSRVVRGWFWWLSRSIRGITITHFCYIIAFIIIIIVIIIVIIIIIFLIIVIVIIIIIIMVIIIIIIIIIIVIIIIKPIRVLLLVTLFNYVYPRGMRITVKLGSFYFTLLSEQGTLSLPCLFYLEAMLHFI